MTLAHKGAQLPITRFLQSNLTGRGSRLETSYIGYGRFSHTFQPLERDTVMEILLESGEALAEVVVTGSMTHKTRYKPLRWERLK